MLGDSPWASLLWMLFCVAAVTALAYWFTKFVLGKKQIGKNRNLDILSSIQIGKNQRIAVIRAGDRYYLLGLTEQSITKISELSQEEAQEFIPQQQQTPTFHEAFKQQMEKKFRGEKK